MVTEVTTDRGIEIARMLFEASLADETTIDFNDMLYMALKRGAPFHQQDFVVVDEVQDLNGIQRVLLARMLKRDGRLIAVGDPAQAIYGFRGADADSMEQLRTGFAAQTFPLSVSYRCPKAVVAEARQYVDHIEAHESAPDGTVETLSTLDPRTLCNTDAVLCRNTAPLVALAYKLLSRKIGCRILGREIGQGLVNLINKMRANDIDSLARKLDEYKLRETGRLLSRGKDDQVQALDDKVESIHAAISSMDTEDRSVATLCDHIQRLFSDDTNGNLLTLSTVHRSKGLEYQRVYILDRALMPSRYARQDWQKSQERNLIYVAITRSMSELYYIDSKNIL